MCNTTENRVAVLAIIIEDPTSVEPLNGILHDNRTYIVARMGVPYKERNVSIISVAVDAPCEVISAMSGKIGRLNGITVKAVYSKL